jgi:hypothetical protein
VKENSINRALHIFAFGLKNRFLKRKRNANVICCGFYNEENFCTYKTYHNLRNMFRCLIRYFLETDQYLCGHLDRSAVDIYVWLPLLYVHIFSRMERKFRF